MRSLWMLPIALAPGCAAPSAAVEPPAPFVVVLGTAQDAGHPQAGCERDCCRGVGPEGGHLVASLGIVDPVSGQRWLIDASPDLPEQLRDLDRARPPGSPNTPLDGVFLTHAHIGHYTGLMYLGREAMGSDRLPVWAMPRMTTFLRDNGPWSQLVALGNIELRPLGDGEAVSLNERLRVRPFRVPHRDEFSETVGFVIEGPSRKVAWLPDIDKWGRWSRPIEDLVREVDVAFVDGTFYADGEIPRDMSEIPHPFIVESIDRLGSLPDAERKGVRFVHFNHTNPALRDDSEAAATIRERGFDLARRGQRVVLR